MDGAWVPVLNMEEGTAMNTVLATWLFMQCSGDGNVMAVRTGLANQDAVEFGVWYNSIPRGFMVRDI